MGKKKGLAAIFCKPKLTDVSPSTPWPWPSCANTPETASFRRQADDDDRPCTTAGRSGPDTAGKATVDMYRMVNSVYVDPADSPCFCFDGDVEEGGDDEFDEAFDDGVSYSTATATEEWSEAIIRSLGRRTPTGRFFFDSGGLTPVSKSNSILAATRSPSPSPLMIAAVTQHLPERSAARATAVMPDRWEEEGVSDSYFDEEEFQEEEEEEEPSSPSAALVEESVAVSLDSSDPYGDFRASMEEMVAAHGLRDWASLHEMLLWYLRVNGKQNHALIVGAFVDLLAGLAATPSRGSRISRSDAATTTTTTTTATMTTTRATSRSSSVDAGDGATCSTDATIAAEEQCSPSAPPSDRSGGRKLIVPGDREDEEGSGDQLAL